MEELEEDEFDGDTSDEDSDHDNNFFNMVEVTDLDESD